VRAGSGGDLAGRPPRRGPAHLPPLRPRALASRARHWDERRNCCALPQAPWRKLRTTQVMERYFREVRRRTRPVSSFTNPASGDRSIFGVISHLNRSWE